MKITTELKRIISASFDKKEKEENAKRRAEANDLYNNLMKELSALPQIKKYNEAKLELYNALKPYAENHEYHCDDFYYARSNLDGLKEPTDCSYWFYSNESSYANKNKSDFNNSKDMLMVKLEYEKDLDKIRAILSEYDINI